MSEEKDRLKAHEETEKTVIKTLSLSGELWGGGPCVVDTKDSKVIRIRPFHYDWKYPKE